MEKVNKGGRPKKVIDYMLVEELAAIFCTQQEIANIMKCDLRTLQRDEQFCHIYTKGIDVAKSSLRRMQYKTAMNGNVSMQIWLGKQYLNQREPVQDMTMPSEELDDDMSALDEK